MKRMNMKGKYAINEKFEKLHITEKQTNKERGNQIFMEQACGQPKHSRNEK